MLTLRVSCSLCCLETPHCYLATLFLLLITDLSRLVSISCMLNVCANVTCLQRSAICCIHQSFCCIDQLVRKCFSFSKIETILLLLGNTASVLLLNIDWLLSKSSQNFKTTTRVVAQEICFQVFNLIEGAEGLLYHSSFSPVALVT